MRCKIIFSRMIHQMILLSISVNIFKLGNQRNLNQRSL